MIVEKLLPVLGGDWHRIAAAVGDQVVAGARTEDGLVEGSRYVFLPNGIDLVLEDEKVASIVFYVRRDGDVEYRDVVLPFGLTTSMCRAEVTELLGRPTRTMDPAQEIPGLFFAKPFDMFDIGEYRVHVDYAALEDGALPITVHFSRPSVALN
ncbi:hypothetical protein [Deinococcus pimensis]|uniref:hypothetical protein n=1 Tax=Deinococcus pimensis TaxID=309888 RepID=UPI00047FF7B0|nr:hypothetical protein [Deinococcus pimensis]